VCARIDTHAHTHTHMDTHTWTHTHGHTHTHMDTHTSSSAHNSCIHAGISFFLIGWRGQEENLVFVFKTLYLGKDYEDVRHPCDLV
jgi:hypothetical protein